MKVDCSTAKRALAYANTIEAGMCIFTERGSELVTDVSEAYDNGLYSLVTMEEFIVVDGVVSSPFAINHAAAHWFYQLHRHVFSVWPSLLRSRSVKVWPT
jgi:hypothetical protein